MKLETKHFLLGLLVAFGIKSLIVGMSYEAASCMAVLGSALFLYEKALEQKELKAVKEELRTYQQDLDSTKKDVEQLKSYTNSIKMNGLRSAGGYPGTQR